MSRTTLTPNLHRAAIAGHPVVRPLPDDVPDHPRSVMVPQQGAPHPPFELHVKVVVSRPADSLARRAASGPAHDHRSVLV